MNNLKKVGLTALATTLATSASVAGELSVSGGAALSYTGVSTKSSVNPWAMGDRIRYRKTIYPNLMQLSGILP